MSVSLIIWGNQSEIDENSIFGDILSQFNQIYRASTYDQVLHILETSLNARMILYAGDNTVAGMIPAIQNIHKRFPKVSFIALPVDETKTKQVPVRSDAMVSNERLDSRSENTHWLKKSSEKSEEFSHLQRHGGVHGLTPRQQDVLILITDGRSNKEIARQLGMTEGTVKIHCMAIFRTLNVTNRTQAAMVARQNPSQVLTTQGLTPQYV